MNDATPDWWHSLKRPLKQWCESNAPAIPAPLWNAATLYEAVRASQSVQWRKPLDRFIAVHTWSTLSLIADERTRRYMSKLIHDETSGLRWTIDTGNATRTAIESLSRTHATPPKRQFEQRRDAALKGLRVARDSLAELGHNIELPELLGAAEFQFFRRDVRQFERAVDDQRRAIGRKARALLPENASAGAIMVASFSGIVDADMKASQVPDFIELLSAAERQIATIRTPLVSRHRTRSLYLRELFRGLEHSPVASRRIALLAYASEAVFGEQVDKRSLRRLVSDIVTVTDELDALRPQCAGSKTKQAKRKR